MKRDLSIVLKIVYIIFIIFFLTISLGCASLDDTGNNFINQDENSFYRDDNITASPDYEEKLITSPSMQTPVVMNPEEGIYITKGIRGEKYLNYNRAEGPIPLIMLSTGNFDLIRISKGRFYITGRCSYDIKNNYKLPMEIIYLSPDSVKIFKLSGTYIFKNSLGFAYRGLFENGDDVIVFSIETRYKSGVVSKDTGLKEDILYGILPRTEIGTLAYSGEYVDEKMTSKKISEIVKSKTMKRNTFLAGSEY